MAMAWTEAILDGREFSEEVDADRFRRAFVTLTKTRTTWPAPADFLTVLPDRDQLAIAKTPIKADPERAARAIAEIAAALKA